VHSTGGLDSVGLHLEPSESAHEASAQDAEMPSTSEAEPEFETSSWLPEQMAFAAIDVEAVPVVEPETSVQGFEVSDHERGFEISPALVDPPAKEAHENGHRQLNEVPAHPVELSPMVIDEIVRRVVAQIGDSVVREIAWEVVPDCVERIIEQQTREILAKR
jgi:hypothetical protein